MRNPMKGEGALGCHILDWHDDLSPLHTRAFSTAKCPTLVTCPVPYTFLKTITGRTQFPERDTSLDAVLVCVVRGGPGGSVPFFALYTSRGQYSRLYSVVQYSKAYSIL